MFRYLAAVWNPNDELAARDAERWRHRCSALKGNWRVDFAADGIEVRSADARPGSNEAYPLHSNAGVVLGAVFERLELQDQAAYAARARFGAADSARIVASEGRDLMRSYWGSYVAFVCDTGSARKWVLKDPCGSLPCFWTQIRSLTVLFSCLSDCANLRLAHLTPNWGYLSARLTFGSQAADSTGLNEVHEVHRGECAEVRDGCVSTRIDWSPLTWARSAPLENDAVAIAELRDTALACIEAWGSCHDSVLHRLSGGFDSSSVLGGLSLARNKPKVACVTYYIPGGTADERPWARFAARRAACEHLELARTPQTDLTKVAGRAPSPTPQALSPYLELGAIERTLAAERKATAVFTGHGGDSLLGRHARAFAADDYLRRHGIDLEWLRLAVDVALLVDLSAWTILGRALRSRFRPRGFSRQRDLILMARRLVNRELLDAGLRAQRYPHPWFAAEEEIPWSVVLQLGTLVLTPSFYDPMSTPDAPDPELTAPLFSQPITELCLRIPTYRHLHGGRDRGLAREAFVDFLPPEILHREWKDRAPSFFESMLRSNLPFVREFLLDGMLASRGLLDRAAVEQALNGKITVGSAAWASEILDHLCVEAWLGACMRMPSEAAA